MIKQLTRLANHLDSRGLRKEADYLDKIIVKIAEIDDQEEAILEELTDVFNNRNPKNSNENPESAIREYLKALVYEDLDIGENPTLDFIRAFDDEDDPLYELLRDYIVENIAKAIANFADKFGYTGNDMYRLTLSIAEELGENNDHLKILAAAMKRFLNHYDWLDNYGQ
tara:strand:- start:100 stop:606 length:507 start_codon:yes stop_codon:yes gene_type:complete